jgi:hypothetical protein
VAALRATAAYTRVIGAAVGTIMATIIIAHMISTRPNSVAVQGRIPIIAFAAGAIELPLMLLMPADPGVIEPSLIPVDPVVIERAVNTM